MPTLNAYKDRPGYYIRAWTSNLGNLNYKLKPGGWHIIESQTNLQAGGQISWKQITVLKTVGVVFTDDSGPISPEDEKFRPDPDQVDEIELTEHEAREFLAAIRENSNLTTDQLLNICYILGIDPPVKDVQERYEPAVEKITNDLQEDIKSQNIPLSSTLSMLDESKIRITPNSSEDDYSGKAVLIQTLVTGPKDIEEDDPEWEEGYDQNTLVIILLVPAATRNRYEDFLMHFVTFDEEQISAWSVLTSHELTWEVRSELYSQIGAILPTIARELSKIDAGIRESPADLDIGFSTDKTLTLQY